MLAPSALARRRTAPRRLVLSEVCPLLYKIVENPAVSSFNLNGHTLGFYLDKQARSKGRGRGGLEPPQNFWKLKNNVLKKYIIKTKKRALINQS